MPSSDDSWAFKHLDRLIDSLMGNLEINIGNSLETLQTSSNSSGIESTFGGRYFDEIWSNADYPPTTADLLDWNYYGNVFYTCHQQNTPSYAATATRMTSNSSGDGNGSGYRRFPIGHGRFSSSSGGGGSSGEVAGSRNFQSTRLPSMAFAAGNGPMIVNGVNLATLKFVKPAPQCFHWQNRQHRIDNPNCRLWHPRELCKYHPKCTLSAEVCGFGHPFCGDYCRCDPTNRSLQVNHRIKPSCSAAVGAQRRDYF